MAFLVQQWKNDVSALLEQSRVLNNSIYQAPYTLDKQKAWPSSPEGIVLCKQLEHTWRATLSLWSDPAACVWDEASLVEHGMTTMSLLDAMSSDYVYRTNNAPPTAPLFDYLERTMDMPASFQAMHTAWDVRHAGHADIAEPLHRRLAMIAMCRPHVGYPLDDSVANSTIWSDMGDLRIFWAHQPTPDQAKHDTLHRGLVALPSSMAHFYAYAAKDPLPEKTVQHLLDNCMPAPHEHENTGLMTNWCSWLATVQNSAAQWSCVKERLPQLASTIEIVSCLAESDQVGAAVWEMHCTHVEPEVVAQENTAHLFGM